MDKFFEFLKNNTAIVAVAAGIILFIAMNGITSCVASSNKGDTQETQQEQQEQPAHNENSSTNAETIKLTAAQKDAVDNYSDATKAIVDTLEGCKWAANDGSGSLTVKNGIITEKYGETEDQKTKSKTNKQTFAITALDSIAADQTGAVTWNVLSVLDEAGNTHIMTLSTVNPAANGEGGDVYYGVSCDLFKNDSGYTNNRCCEDVSIPALDDENFKKAIDGHTDELKKSLIDYLLANHSTTTELVWDNTMTEVFGSNVKTFSFGIKNASSGDDDSSLTKVNVTYHTDTHEFEEVDVQ